jgi:tetratricopeptide (TPR) repeat protein
MQAQSYASRARVLAPSSLKYIFHEAVCLITLGRSGEAAEVLEKAEPLVAEDSGQAAMLASLLVRVDQHEAAARHYQTAIALEPANARHRFSLAATMRFLGRLDEAEKACDAAIECDPNEYEAYLIRSDLRTQTPAENHVAAMERVLAQGGAPYMGETMLCFALAKECEDIGDSAQAFRYLERGARLRRKHLSYDVSRDVEIIDELTRQFSRKRLCAREPAGSADPLPLFIIGMPRTGTTLVERMLGSQSRVRSAGELPNFSRCVEKQGRRGNEQHILEPKDLVSASLDFDMNELGADYLDSVRQLAGNATRLIDKLPFNYLNVGLIHLALPAASIVHVRRNPMDTCYAVYKTLFQRAYPFSYDLDDLARYFIAYWHLMEHWRQVLPDRMIEVHYEDLVENPAVEGRRLIEACGLDWEDSMAEFHRNPTASMTASASQVRRPVYRSSVGKWRRYASELRPLSDKLEAAGIPVC